MDDDTLTTITTDPAKPAPLQRIGTIDELRQSLKNRTDGSEVNIRVPQKTIDPTITAQVAHAITYNQDPVDKSRTQKKLEKKLTELELTNPKEYNQIVSGIFELTKKYNDAPIAAGIQDYKERKHSNPNTPTSSSDSPKGKKMVRKILAQQATVVREMADQEKILDEVKEQMRKLTLQAAEEAQHEEQSIARRNMYLGFIGTVGAAVITALATYYSAINAAKISSNSPNTPAPACLCLNGTL
jgi:hypothetical protein